MMGQGGTITGIEAQKQHPHRRSIFVDGVFRLGIDAEVVIKSGLQVGQILDDGDIEGLLLGEEEKKAREYALNLLSFHDRSCQEISDRLRQKGFEAETGQRVVAALVQAGLLDDARLAHQWGAERLNNRPMGARLLAAELRRKGITREAIEHTIENLYAEDSERSLAVRALAAIGGRRPFGQGGGLGQIGRSDDDAGRLAFRGVRDEQIAGLQPPLAGPYFSDVDDVTRPQ